MVSLLFHDPSGAVGVSNEAFAHLESRGPKCIGRDGHLVL